uniref:Chromo domain-containing protein n=1 Tax=Ananas comosus var. bracteatus TaxID=296719 RepID=A0A6V7PK20_ANACO|nr:unnamed protein product [Ananas comosus var. bracteatus]
MQIQTLRRYVFDHSHVIDFTPLELGEDLRYEERPVRILVRETKELRNRVIPYVKVQWSNHKEREATWELKTVMRESYPYLFDAQSTGRATATSGLAKQRPPGGVLQGGVGTGDSERPGEGRGAREAGGEVERGVAAGDVAPVEGGYHACRPALRSGGVGRRRDLRRLLLLLRNGVMVHAGRCTQRRRAGTRACCGCFFFVIMV